MIAITPDGKTAYVVDEVDHSGWGTVTPITTATNTAGKPINVGAVAPDDRDDAGWEDRLCHHGGTQ